MEVNLTYLLLGGGIALGFKIIFDWLKNRKVENHNPGQFFETLCSDVKWLKEVHAKTDEDGTPIWYVPREWKKSMDVMNERTMRTNLLLEGILGEMKEMRIGFMQERREK